MTSLKPVGIYREMYRNRAQDLPSIYAAFAANPITERSRIVAYMKSGTPIFDVLTDVPDLLGRHELIRGGPSLISDGQWVWRVDSWYYLATYPLDIPTAFLGHARGQGYRLSGNVVMPVELIDRAIASYF